MDFKKISIQEVIESGVWLEATYAESAALRFKLKKLEKIDLNAIYKDPYESTYITENLTFDPGLDANIWRLDIDAVNMTLDKIYPFQIWSDIIGIQDQDNYNYSQYNNTTLTHTSNYAKSTGLRKFGSIHMPPKIKKSGAFCFELPEFFEELFIISKNGTIKEC
jgi:hypothetical protein